MPCWAGCCLATEALGAVRSVGTNSSRPVSRCLLRSSGLASSLRRRVGEGRNGRGHRAGARPAGSGREWGGLTLDHALARDGHSGGL